MPLDALTSAEISLPATPDASQVRERIAVLSRHVDLVGLTDNHAGKPRMSPLAAVALAREQGVATVVHVSCRDRNRLALRSQVIGAAALGSEGILCLYGDPVPDVPRVRDYTTTKLLAEAKEWAAPAELALGCVADPFGPDSEAELALLGRKVAAGADFVQTQMVFDPAGLAAFLDQAAEGGKLGDCRVHASVPVIRTARMVDILNQTLPCQIPEKPAAQIAAGGGIDLAVETAMSLAALDRVHALHVMSWGSEEQAGQVAAAFRTARGAPAERRPRLSAPQRGMAVALNSLRSGQSSTMVRTRSRVERAASGEAGRSIRRTNTARWVGDEGGHAEHPGGVDGPGVVVGQGGRGAAGGDQLLDLAGVDAGRGHGRGQDLGVVQVEALVVAGREQGQVDGREPLGQLVTDGQAPLEGPDPGARARRRAARPAPRPPRDGPGRGRRPGSRPRTGAPVSSARTTTSAAFLANGQR